MKPRHVCHLLAFVMTFYLSALQKFAQQQTADTIYVGGNILTMDDAQPTAEAIAIRNGKILAVGSTVSAMTLKGSTTKVIQLDGKTLIPGFVDAHGHLGGVGLQAVSANLLPPPDGPGSSIPALQRVMREFIQTSPKVKEYGVAIGFNYDDSQLAEHRHPTRKELDAIATDIPIVLIHQSGHLAVMNGKALEKVGYNAQSQNPPGGIIRREEDGKTPNGVLEEMAHINATGKLLPKFTSEQRLEVIDAGQKIYAANGFTTAQEGRASPGLLAMLAEASAKKKLEIDVVAYADLVMAAEKIKQKDYNPILFVEGEQELPTGMPPALIRLRAGKSYRNHFRVGGVKLTFDGSPQGKTAWLTKPYFVPPDGQSANYKGYPAFPKEGEAQRWVDVAFKNHFQTLVHANGDAAIDELIKTVGNAEKQYGAGDRRTVLIHGQYLRADQIPQLKALGIIPSLYPMHTFYWGDWHRHSVAGPERAAFISPTAAVLKEGMTFTIHSDAPVTFPNSMRILDSAVNRTTRSGFILGPDQRLSPEIALKAMTIWPAYQHFEETTKGSLRVGKLADLVILSDNPLTVPSSALKDIKIVTTIKEGQSIYTAARQ
jgi:predicted amidohydrolase YtcJ